MTRKHADHSQLIYQVVRGERPCTDLFELGIKMQLVDDAWQIESPPLEPVQLRIADVAHGLLKYKSNPDDLKKWARLILSGSGFIDLEECETQTGWDVLLNALWAAMDTGAFSNSALHVAEELAN